MSYFTDGGATGTRSLLLGVKIPDWKPRMTGQAEHFTASPSLPPGLMIDDVTGKISGGAFASTPGNKPFMVTLTASDNGGNSSKNEVTFTVVQPIAVQISSGGRHTCVVYTLNGVKSGILCWGANKFGELGDGAASDMEPATVQVQGIGTGVASVSAGSAHTCAISNNQVFCWGNNQVGQVGNANLTATQATPVAVAGLNGKITALAAGSFHTCAVVDGSAWCWGLNENGQLGAKTTDQCRDPKSKIKSDSSNCSKTPVKVVGIQSPVLGLSAGDAHTCAFLKNGKVTCWGTNHEGQLAATDTKLDIQGPTEIPLRGRLMIDQDFLASGPVGVCATVGASLQCWGHRYDKDDKSQGVYSVDGLPTSYSSIAVGRDHACVTSNGDLYCWGDNSQGELALRTSETPSTNKALPVGNRFFDAVTVGGFAGEAFTCALVQLRDGTGDGVQCWGANGAGQLGADFIPNNHTSEPRWVTPWASGANSGS